MRDVTQKLRAEQQRREFTANVSHELKTPLHTISGYAELLGCGMVHGEDVAAFSEKIRTEAKRLTQLVEDILRLSRLDEGVPELHWETVDLYALARETLASLSVSAEAADVTVSLEGAPAFLWGAPQLLSSVVFNLVDNAIKYNRAGGMVTVTVTQSGSGTRLSVADTGVGISQEHQERIFERFYRVDKSRSKAAGGTGLGLSIVKHAAQIHGARIKLESVPGTGTIVTLVFPDQQKVSQSVH